MTFKVKGFRHTVLFPERHLNAKWFKYKLNYKKDSRNPCEQWWEEDFFYVVHVMLSTSLLSAKNMLHLIISRSYCRPLWIQWVMLWVWDVPEVTFLQSNIILMWHECGMPVLELAGAVVTLPELCDETDAMLFLLLTWHMFNCRVVLSWKGPTRIIEPNS